MPEKDLKSSSPGRHPYDATGSHELTFGMEPTADYHKPLGEYLITLGHMVVLVAGAAVKNNRELLDGRWDKHDPRMRPMWPISLPRANVSSMSSPLWTLGS